MEAHASLAVPQVQALVAPLTVDVLRTAIAVTPILEELRKATVTRNTLTKLSASLAILQRYKKHGDPLINVSVKTLLAAWRTIYQQGAEGIHWTAADVLGD